MKSYKISLAGDLGSGKSTVGDILTKKYSMEKVSIGVMLRELATEHNMNVTEFNKYMETHPEIDNLLDDKLKSYEDKEGRFLFDSRLAWNFVPSSFSVYMTADIETSAERILNANRSTEMYADKAEAIKQLVKRRESETLRYNTLYGVNILDMNNYDLVVKTDNKTVLEVADEISKAFETWLKKVN